MIPTPRVSRIPRCIRCAAPNRSMKGGREFVIVGDGPAICRDCIHMCVRLAGVTRADAFAEGTET